MSTSKVSSPNPNWQAGESVSSPVESTTEVDVQALPAHERYKLLIGSIVPRPIAFVSTCDSQGNLNLAPYSFFSGVSSEPAAVVISVGQHRGGKEHKDTLSNILETKEFVVNTANDWMIEAVVHAAGDFAHGISEFEQTGLTPLDSRLIKPKRVKESAVQLECKLYDTMQVGPQGQPGSSTLVVGEVVYAHVFSEAYQNGRIDFSKIQNIGRLGGFSYGRITEIFDIEVPKVSEQ